MSDANIPLVKLTSLKTWRLQNLKSGEYLFPTLGSMQWFVLTNRDALIK